MKAIITIAMLFATLFSANKEKKADIWNMGLYADSTRLHCTICTISNFSGCFYFLINPVR